MEDHREAYFFWKELGLRGLCCIHVDAHLDISGFKVPGYTGMRQPEVHCGNYLLPALREGLVEELVCVVPPHLRGEQELLEWALEELQCWVIPSVDEYMDLALVEGRVEGHLEGKRLVICHSDNLPTTELPVALDIDIDYYLSPEDTVWQSPLQLADHLQGFQPVAVTIAYSVEGGYTPLRLRHLGEVTSLAFDQPARARGFLEVLEGGGEPQPEQPDWLRAALVAAQGEDASAIDPGYQVRAMDLACGALMRERFQECGRWLEQLPADEVQEREYLMGFLAFREERHQDALTHWGRLLESEELDRATRTHLLELYGRVQARMGDPGAAIGTFEKALKSARRDVSLWLELARAQADAELYDQAARSYRKSISLSPENLSRLEAQLELARIYHELGQVSLARTQCRRVIEGRAPAFMKLQAEMTVFKLAVR